ncbi:hypothetical protein HGM15179_001913 [Zosterops borbonicus]|uniref:Uncharacterized protein n=1 Tax=Zosterops borbonicus TaxID=364589 RepID=A0A8K1GUW2_9PASS|nr:hypothetical protein HGM15179_001913 [Zosterops borbonicus]
MSRERSQREGAREEECSQMEDPTGRVRNEWEQVQTVEEISRWGAGGCRELYKRQVRVQLREVCRGRDESGEEIYEWEGSVTIREVCQWEEDGEQHEEVWEWEKSATAQEAAQRETDIGRPQEFEWEEDERSSEVSPETDGSFLRIPKGTTPKSRCSVKTSGPKSSPRQMKI